MPNLWRANQTENVLFIHEFHNAAALKNVTLGIYTNWHDWWLITGNTRFFPSSLLWFWSANGLGKSGETSQNVSDFLPFGPFKRAHVKQYGIRTFEIKMTLRHIRISEEDYCGITVNSNFCDF
ncbi:hypothetical protein M3Y99_01300600 [Aphelenchoides fujianensis]|nr:hypothetical protein M3Y99_01300600 [Aphelenchoides fujianensis]